MLLEAAQAHLDHADGALDDLPAGGDDGLGLLAPQHGLGDLGGVGEVREATVDDLEAGDVEPGLDLLLQAGVDLVLVAAQGDLAVVRVVGEARGDGADGRLALDGDEAAVFSTSSRALALSVTRQTITAAISIGLPRASLTLSFSLLKLCTRKLTGCLAANGLAK
ncbi:hypothetical protein OV079_09955 [Nannocystis pusilla]|uniref:Uncharacterized protein n=1 Tax=Nannocystis pusilla TaxID=889268 RepID=A0A9X3EST7_9BACT|nr:hypothetical protein [Nannocystis pusilla]MCY1005886.1 hypothetical protein [Nannocystis pusilla]